MTQRLCDLSQHEEYYCYMNKLLLSAGKAGDPAHIKYYLRSFPRSVPNVVEQYFNEHNPSILL